MIEAQRGVYAIAIAGAAVLKAASAAATPIDTKGYDYVELMLMSGTNDVVASTVKVTECDTSDGSYTDVPGAKIASIPANVEKDLFVFQINMLRRKRFLKMVVTTETGTTGGYYSAVARLSRGDMPVNASEAGVHTLVRV